MSGQSGNGSKDTHKKKHTLRNVIIAIPCVLVLLILAIFIFQKARLTFGFPKLNGEPKIGQWYSIYPEGAKSSDGSEWYGLMRLGSRDKVIVYFFGGGVSINEYTAAHPESFYAANANNQAFLTDGGISSGGKENLFRDWTILVCPYSTGDFHTGTGEYPYTDDSGNQKVLYHNGYLNYSLFLDETLKYVGAPDTLLVTGFSAGGFGTSLLADDVISRFPSVSNATVVVDSSLLLMDNWHDVAANIWHSPEEILERLHTNNIVLDSLTALSDKRGDSVKILFDCSVRDGELAKYQSYIDTGVSNANAETGDVFQANLKAMVEGLQQNIPNVGIYIWDGYSYLFDKNLTQHTIISTKFFAPLNGGRSICDWIMDAVNGDVQTYGLDLFDQY